LIIASSVWGLTDAAVMTLPDPDEVEPDDDAPDEDDDALPAVVVLPQAVSEAAPSATAHAAAATCAALRAASPRRLRGDRVVIVGSLS
jgi:hypothetical protein